MSKKIEMYTKNNIFLDVIREELEGFLDIRETHNADVIFQFRDGRLPIVKILIDEPEEVNSQ